MAEPDDEREARAEDLFEDLDKYFAPIREEGWPEGDEPSAERPREEGEPATKDRGATGPPERRSEPTVQDEWSPPSIEIPAAEELLGARPEPPAPPPEMEPPAPPVGMEPPAPPVGGEPPAPPVGAEPSPGAGDIAAADEEAPPPLEAPGQPAPEAEVIMPQPAEPPGGWLSEPTAEMSGEDWERFRRALDEERTGEAVADEVPEPSAAASAPPAEEPRDLTVDDLKSAPPQYAELVAPDEEPVLAEEATLGVPPADAARERAEPSRRPFAEEAPGPEAVEAAAEHFAGGLRESPEDIERELLADLDEPPGAPATIRVEPVEEGPPPSWREPTTDAVTEEVGTPPPPTGRNVPAAFASGILLAVAGIALLAIGKGPFAVLAGVVIVLGQAELYAVISSRGARPATALGLVTGALMIAAAYLRGEPGVVFALFLSMALSVLWFMAAPLRARQGTTANVGATLFGVVYVPFLASFALVMLRFPGDIGRNLLLTVVGLTVLYDICAYAIGSLWGSRPLAPTISPKKSWEGVVGATFVLLLVALAVIPSIEPFTAATAVGLALVIAVAAPIGDLVESAIKRDLGVKDMGTLLPGHGGILDRVDAILFTAPAAWYFFRLVIL